MGEIIKAWSVKGGARNGLTSEPTANQPDLAKMLSALEKVESTAKAAVIDLALDMAGRIVLKTVELDPEVLMRIYAKALESTRGLERATIRVHPLDREASSIEALAAGREFEIVDDPAVGRAGCRITACGLEVDASLDTLLDAFERALKGSQYDRD